MGQRRSTGSPAAALPEVPPLKAALAAGVKELARLQQEDGAWRCDYGGPMFLLPMYVAARQITGRPIPAGQREQMVRYLRGALQADGSFGLHQEDGGCMFTSALGYSALRFLGLPADDPDVARLRRWIRGNGTPLCSASWGKWVLALLNLYEYEGLHPVLPELWLLPRAAPMHPGRFWCHCRQVYLPMAYLYGIKARMPVDPLVRALRSELYDRPYPQIPFADYRDTVAPGDNQVPISPLLARVNRLQDAYEAHHSRWLRRRALAELFDHIRFEDEVTHFIRIGPVNAVLNTLVHYFQDPRSNAVERSLQTLEQYLWQGHDGLKMNGYNSTALWDTAFAVQALLALPEGAQPEETVQRAHGYIRENQVLEDVPQKERYFRHASRGGWPFSDRAHGWPITDCTAEGLRCALRLGERAGEPLPQELLEASVELILSFQNADGGWASYERQRGGRWLELLNPSTVFHDIMVDYSYVECSSACLQGLAQARSRLQGELAQRTEQARRRGEAFLRQSQRADGSWEGSWAVCFTYGSWFGVCGLLAAGAAANDPALQRTCRFLQEQQNADGGWGEHFRSCAEGCYIPAASHAVQTAWALLALVHAGQGQSEAAQRGAAYLLQTQTAAGDWPRQGLIGVFNKTALIDYDNYRRYFPLWALALYAGAKAAA